MTFICPDIFVSDLTELNILSTSTPKKILKLYCSILSTNVFGGVCIYIIQNLETLNL